MIMKCHSKLASDYTVRAAPTISNFPKNLQQTTSKKKVIELKIMLLLFIVTMKIQESCQVLVTKSELQLMFMNRKPQV